VAAGTKGLRVEVSDEPAALLLVEDAVAREWWTSRRWAGWSARWSPRPRGRAVVTAAVRATRARTAEDDDPHRAAISRSVGCRGPAQPPGRRSAADGPGLGGLGTPLQACSSTVASARAGGGAAVSPCSCRRCAADAVPEPAVLPAA